jgi:Fe-S cluster assembly protein SufD
MSPTATFDEEALAASPASSPFVADMRKQAFQEFLALPIPSQETEEWRYTDLSDFDLSFAPFTAGGGPESLAGTQTLNETGVVGERAGLQIQRNSEVVSTRMAESLAEKGVIFCDLDRAAVEHPDLVEPHLHTLVPTSRTKFTALHAAFRTGGTFLYVPPAVTVEMPLQTLTYLDADGAAVFPHTLIVVGQDAEVTFIDRYASPALGRALSVAVTEIHAGPASRVRYVSLQDWGEGMTHLGIVRTRLSRDVEFRSVAVGFGASLARAEAEAELAEPGAFSEMLGVFFADETQHFDHRSVQDHVAPNCKSDLLYKGALKGHSRAVYSGWVHVHKEAQKTDAMQTSRNIVLSEHAKADAIPNLEIEANDVRCGHAASVGPVEEDTLFYLQSRGIPRKEAERLVVFGFFGEVLDRIALTEVRESVSHAIEEELASEDVA